MESLFAILYKFASLASEDSNLAILKTGKARAIRFTTLNAICRVLDCKPGDILDYEPDPEGIRIVDDDEI